MSFPPSKRLRHERRKHTIVFVTTTKTLHRIIRKKLKERKNNVPEKRRMVMVLVWHPK